MESFMNCSQMSKYSLSDDFAKKARAAQTTPVGARGEAQQGTAQRGAKPWTSKVAKPSTLIIIL
jgi:hypothetical protein